MRQISLLGAAAIFVVAVAAPSVTQAACAMYDPSCATYPMPKKDDGLARSRSARAEFRADVGAQPAYRSTAPMGRVEQRTTVRYVNDGGGPVRAAGAVAVGAAATAGAIATAPFRAADSYAYYNEGYNGWDRRSYAERNGFVCTPGELFKGFDGRLHVCQ